MKKLALTFLICLFTVLLSAPSYAEWKKVGATKTANIYTEIYINFSTVRKRDGRVFLWQLDDFAEQVNDFKSVKKYTEIDCNTMRSRNLQMVAYKYHMGRGNGVSYPIKQEWDYLPTDTVGYKFALFACKFKF